MNYRVLFLLLCLVFSGGCAGKPLAPVVFAPPSRIIDYLTEVKPVLVKRCVVCHSCYNSPCQLKLSSFTGLDRGASKQAVYNASRLQTMQPTRLFMDAESTEQWRTRGFHSVTQNSAPVGQNDSLMMQLLSHKKDNPINNRDEFYPEATDLTCSENGVELGAYLREHPNRGMPFGFPPLTTEEFNIIGGWLVQGAHGPNAQEQAILEAVPATDRAKIEMWEEFFNTEDAKHKMTARYLYEHLFLAHLTFGTGENTFYELVRSKTPTGQAIKVIATVLPYDSPGEGPFYYRIRKIHSTIVHKTHMVFDMSDGQLARFKELFIGPKWLLEPKVMGYEKQLSANPFELYEQIPTRSRYQFLLDNNHYILMTFIRGPVCKGQVALNVIQDHFWTFFLDPDYDLSVKYPGFLQTYSNYLEMPIIEKTDGELARSVFTRKYRKKASAFVKKRSRFYSIHYRYRELDRKAIWAGTKQSDTPLLTVFRHFDSASVLAGALGNLPKTLWVLDYPLLERIYYSLVAGFNVYGTAMHQLTIRTYMDELRQEAETNFIDFMPLEKRRTMMQEWYGKIDISGSAIDYSPSDLDAGFHYVTGEPKREFVESLVKSYFKPEQNIRFDVNYLYAGEAYPPLPEKYVTIADYLQGFKSVSRPGASFFSHVLDHNANLAYVRIMVSEDPKEDVYISVVINRWHDDVTTLFREANKLRPKKDQASFVEGFVGSYPNYFYEVSLQQLPQFLEGLQNFDGSAKYWNILNTFGVNRADDRFWQVYDRFQARFDRQDPAHAGLFDLNRYYFLAITREME
ncbi:MAG: peptidylprolyl isomerase [Desulfotalea sp.]|nr:MAG: peptidylprolyl isomerase [Desulfotalea sp.]